MSATVAQILALVNGIAPFELAEPWDNVGLLAGRPDARVDKVLCALDLSGRSTLRFDLRFAAWKVGTFDTELVEEFFLAFTRAAGVTLHLKQLDGTNTHHIIEAAFKGVGRALRQAVAIDAAAADEIPSTKGVLG